ncbi:MAG: hypothetical protein K6G45_05535 [Lachnospiraceae bacterium]|nr:hypothetical protein [Lachnospiraceae bacterium]
MIKKKAFRFLILLLIFIIAITAPVNAEASNKKPSKPKVTLTVTNATEEYVAVQVRIGKTKNAKSYELYEKRSGETGYQKICTLNKDGTKVQKYIIKYNHSDEKINIKVRGVNGTSIGKFSNVKTVNLGKYKETEITTTSESDKEATQISQLEKDPETTVVSGRTVNKLPYTIEGLTITGISFNSWSATVKVKNGTGQAITNLSSIAYKCYDKTGTVVSSGKMYLEDTNNGESCKGIVVIDSDVVKIIFGSVSIKQGSKKEDKDTTVISGYKVNKLPYTTEGLSITGISFNSWSATVTVKNGTGNAIGNLSSIAYKCFEANETVVSSGKMYLEDTNNGESCTGTVVIDSSVAKIIFGSANVKQGNKKEKKETTVISGRTVNKLPYTTEGLTITGISFNSWSATVTVKNETGHAIDNLSSIAYKCFDANETVVSSGKMYLENANNGESCTGTVVIDENVVKILFDEGIVQKGTERVDQDTTIISGRTVNKLPYTTEGLTITGIGFNSWSATVTVKNETGYAIDNLSSITYKCFDANGTVVSSGKMYLENANNGESCTGTVVIDENVVKILFDAGIVRKGIERTEKETTTVLGRTVNKLPYTTEGLTITGIRFNSWSATVTVKNGTGYTIGNLSSIVYKCYDTKGTVVSSGKMYLEDANNGESCTGTVVIDSDVAKILFFEGTVKKK